MTGAELDTQRRAYGLSVGEAASVCGVSERTFSAWVSDDTQPRDWDEVKGRLQAVGDAMGDAIDRHVEMVSERFAAAAVPLTRYRTQAALDASPHVGLPLGAHAMMTALLAEDLRADGHEVVIRWAAP